MKHLSDKIERMSRLNVTRGLRLGSEANNTRGSLRDLIVTISISQHPARNIELFISKAHSSKESASTQTR